MGNGWLTEQTGRDFTILALGTDVPGMTSLQPPITDTLRARYLGMAAQAVYLIRPDQIIAARWHNATPNQITTAIRTARGAA